MHTYQVTGKGSPLLMLHGWGQTHENLLPLAKLLSPVASPRLVDLPGFGQSPGPDTCWSAFDYAEEIIRHLDHEHISACALLGHSFGGKVAMCTAIRYPERVSRLVLLAPSGLLPRRGLRQNVRQKSLLLGGKLLKVYDTLAGTDTFARLFVPRFGSKDYQMAGEMRRILVRSVNEDLSREVVKIQCPTLLLWGEQDTETPFEMGCRLHKLIPNAELIPLPHQGHQLVEDVGAHLCASKIRPFLQEVRI